MKVLVVTNCATAAYTSGLRALFPEWEVKGAEIATAVRFISERKPDFLNYMSSAGLLVTSMPDDPMFENFPPDSTKLVIPNFIFRACHPDSLYLGNRGQPARSIFAGTSLHSRLVVTAFILGVPAAEAVAAFRAESYERVGYFSVFPSERDGLLGRFGAVGIDIAADFERWVEGGNFLHTFNHPRAFVFADVLLAALKERYLSAAKIAKARNILAAVPDYLEDSLSWPVYPEIAARHGFRGSLVWRLGRAAGGRQLSLAEFVQESFAVLSEETDLLPAAVPGFEDCAAAIRA